MNTQYVPAGTVVVPRLGFWGWCFRIIGGLCVGLILSCILIVVAAMFWVAGTYSDGRLKEADHHCTSGKPPFDTFKSYKSCMRAYYYAKGWSLHGSLRE